MKTTISDAKGVVSEGSGNGLQVDTTVTLASSPSLSLTALTSDTTLTAGGVYTISGNSPVVVTMPLAATVPGSLFIFRNASATAHKLTGSQESNGTLVFAGSAGTGNNSGHGSAATFQAILGNSSAYLSDGKSFILTAVSGTMTFNGT
jgi:hypothetical protein